MRPKNAPPPPVTHAPSIREIMGDAWPFLDLSDWDFVPADVTTVPGMRGGGRQLIDHGLGELYRAAGYSVDRDARCLALYKGDFDTLIPLLAE